MLTSLIGSFFILLIGITAFYGNGQYLTAKLLRIDGLGVAINLCLGYSVFLCACGYLEIIQWGGQAFFYAFTALGIIFSLWLTKVKGLINFYHGFVCKFKTLSLRHRIYFFILLLVNFTFIFAYLINLSFYPFNEGDDFQGYLVLAQRILDEGYQGGDVFNLRAIVQGFGGGNYVNAFFLDWMPIKWMHLAEGGVGLIFLLALAVNQVAKTNDQLLQVAYAGACVCVYVIFIPIVNITPILSGSALAIGILLLSQYTPPVFSWRIAILMGLLAAALTLLKGTLLVPAIVFCAAHYFARLFSLKKLWIAKEITLSAITYLLLLAPWAYSNYIYFDTLFYPILGVGLVSSGGFGIFSIELWLDNLYQYHPLYLLTIATWFLLSCYETSANKNYKNFLLLFYFLSTLLLSVTPGGGFRYNFILLSVPSLFFLIEYLSIPIKNFRTPFSWLSESVAKKILITIACVTLLMMANQVKRVGKHFFEKGVYSRLLATTQSLADADPLSENFPDQRIKYEGLQKIIPEHSNVIVAVNEPYLFDFSRNRFYVADVAGTTGFRPGVPFEGSVEDLRQYLLSNNIRYVVHTYKGWSEITDFYEMHSKIEWVRNQVIRYFAVNKQLLGLADLLQPILDNGSERVFDLCHRNEISIKVCKN